MSDFLQTVTDAFKSLLSRGLLNVEFSGDDAEAFGNAVVVLAGRNVRIRLVRDRGDVVAQAASASDPNNWFPLQRVIRAVNASFSTHEGLLTPAEAAGLVERSFTDLDSGLGAACIDQTKAILAELERFAMKRVMDHAKRRE